MAFVIAKKATEICKIEGIDIYIEVEKGIKPRAGLGSSGASSAAVAAAISHLLGLKLTSKELIFLAGLGEEFVAGEAHYDNVSASILGGFVFSDLVSKEFYKLEVREKFTITVITPEIHIAADKTKAARGILPIDIRLKDAIYQLSQVSLLTYAIIKGDLELFGKAISRDFIAEPIRKKLIPYYDDIKTIAFERGALGFNIAGAGPSVFFITKRNEEGLLIGEELKEFYANKGISSSVTLVFPTNEGTKILVD